MDKRALRRSFSSKYKKLRDRYVEADLYNYLVDQLLIGNSNLPWRVRRSWNQTPESVILRSTQYLSRNDYFWTKIENHNGSILRFIERDWYYDNKTHKNKKEYQRMQDDFKDYFGYKHCDNKYPGWWKVTS